MKKELIIVIIIATTLNLLVIEIPLVMFEFYILWSENILFKYIQVSNKNSSSLFDKKYYANYTIYCGLVNKAI